MPPKDATTEKTTAEIHAEAGQLMASIPGGTGNPAPVNDPMLNGQRAIRNYDADALRIWKTTAPKDVGGVLSAYLIDATDIVLLHQLPSGRFSMFRKVAAL